MMEFEEMQKIWNEQKGETMYAINETALHRSITRKKNAAGKKINRVETGLTIINSITALILLVLALRGSREWNFINCGIMVITVAYVRYFRWKRKREENMFERNMLGELNQAISNANSIMRFNYLMLVGYLLPFGILTISKLIVVGAPIEKWLIITGMFLLAVFLVRWEQQACNIPRKKQLLVMRKKLMEE